LHSKKIILVLSTGDSVSMSFWIS